MNLRALLVDDEPLARKRLRALLEPHAGIEIAGEAGTVDEAAELARHSPVDVIFLDIQMPRKNGFALLPLLTSPLPHIIFVTAYHEYALRAFEVNAADYLLKPVEADRLAIAVARIHGKPQPLPGFESSDSVLLTDGKRMQLTPLSTITAIEAEGNYSRVHLSGDDAMLVLRSIGSWSEALPQPPFLRADRSLLIHMGHFARLTTQSRNESVLALKGLRREFVLGRAATSRLRSAMRG
ncbi:MAG: response regulator transcription factor [Bryobacterales bacterium]|nr:response regulator transcription factor [Bryobacterales bacterium]